VVNGRLEFVFNMYESMQSESDIFRVLPRQLPLKSIENHLRTFMKQVPQRTPRMAIRIIPVYTIDDVK